MKAFWAGVEPVLWWQRRRWRKVNVARLILLVDLTGYNHLDVEIGEQEESRMGPIVLA